MATISEKKPLTMRQKAVADRILKNAAEGKAESAAKILKDTGYKGSTLQQPARVLQKQSLQDYLQEHLPASLQQKVLADALNAKTVVAYKGDARETDAPDYATRLKALSLAGDFMGTKVVNIRQTSVNVNASPEELRQLLGYS